MSNFGNFGGLTLKSSETEDDIDVFSTIDLDGAGQLPKNSDSAEINEIVKNHQDNNNNNTEVKRNSSYTSFGEALSNKTAPVKVSNQTSEIKSNPKRMVPSESINSTDYVHVQNFDQIKDAQSANRDNNISPTSMLSSASDVSSKLAYKTASTLESFRLWGKSAYKCTRQIVSEKLGKTSRTIDPELDVMIDNLRDTKKRYGEILAFSRNMAIHFSNIMQTQRYLTDTFADLAQKSPELITEFTTNAETQRTLIKHGEHLLNAINHFINSLNTLCNKTMEDTFLTIGNYEAARVEYDAYRFDLEALRALPENKVNQIDDLEHEVSIYKERYENLKKDVQIKIKFLDENRIKVMKKQLNQFQVAISIYFSGNHEALQQTMNQIRENQINFPQKSTVNHSESFLEQ